MPTITLGDMIARVYSRLDENSLLYTRPEVVQEINDSISLCNLFCGVIQSTTPINTVGKDLYPPNGQLIYQTPAGMIWPTAVAYEGRDLSPMSLLDLATQYRSWATDVSSPGRPVKEWAPIGFNQFVIHPIDSLGGRFLSVTGVVEPTPLVLDTDPIPLPNDFCDDIEELAASVLPIREGGRIFNAAVSTLFSAFVEKMRTKTAFTSLVWPAYFQKLSGRKPPIPAEAVLPGANQ